MPYWGSLDLTTLFTPSERLSRRLRGGPPSAHPHLGAVCGSPDCSFDWFSSPEWRFSQAGVGIQWAHEADSISSSLLRA